MVVNNLFEPVELLDPFGDLLKPTKAFMKECGDLIIKKK